MQYHPGQSTLPRLTALLQSLGVSISKRATQRLLIEKQDRQQQRKTRTRVSTLAVPIDFDAGEPSAPAAAGCAASMAFRHVQSRPLLIRYRRATAVGDTPGWRLSAAIACFCSRDHRRRGSLG